MRSALSFISRGLSLAFVIALGATAQFAYAQAALENPQPGSYQSGIGLLSGWSCQGPGIVIAIDGAAPLNVPYGSARADTASVCGAGNTSTGYGLLINFNTLGEGTHSAQLYVNGTAQGSPTPFTVTVPAGEFLTGAAKQVTVSDFPVAGAATTLVWQQAQQNFAIRSVASAALPLSLSLAEQCVTPRPAGTIDPFTNRAYGDTQGSITIEKAWMRSYVNETYLWYQDVPFVDPSLYVVGATVPYVRTSDNARGNKFLTSNGDVVDAYFNSQRSP